VTKTLRSSTNTANTPPPAIHHRPAATPASSPALRNKIATKDKEIAQLKATLAEQQTTIELLYGQLQTRHEKTT
jgi:hypothetical protein